MNPTDTRAKLEHLFRRLTDPTISDLDALADFVWFRKERLAAEDVKEALGAGNPSASGTAEVPTSEGDEKPAPANGGADILTKVATFGKYSAKKQAPNPGWTWGRVLREDREWLVYMSTWEKSQPWMVKTVREVLAATPKETP